MESLFLKLVELSITGSLFALAVVLLRLIFRKAPKWVFCLLWGLVAVRLVLPFSIESSFSVIPGSVSEKQIAAQMAQSYVGDVTYIYEGAEKYQAAVDAGRRPIQSGEASYVVTQKDSLEEPKTVKTAVLPLLSRIWIAGVALMLGYTLVSYLTLRKKVSTATLLRDNIKQSELVDSPFVLGLFRPVIYLPYEIADGDRENVIAHERAHIQRKDHWWKPIGFLILSIHWFNPIMWLSYILLCRDIEDACDEKVIKKLDKDGIRAYSTALLNCSIRRRTIAACPLAFGEVGVKERIKRVMHYKKPAFWIVLLALIASAAAAVLLLTSPKADEQLLMGAYYRAAELLYTNKQEQTEVFSRFCITADYRLLAQKQGHNSWVLNKKMEKYPLTAEELRICTDYADGWHEPYRMTEIEDAYILRVENNYFYLVAKTKSGDTLLGFGGADPTGNPGDDSLRYLYRLESEFEPGEVDLDFLAQSLLLEAGIVNVIDVWQSEDNPGFLVAGLTSGYQYSVAADYDDMGYAVFQTDGTGYRLLNCKMYEDVLYSENGIFICPDPVVLSQDEELKADVTFDLIISANEDLNKVQREYYKDGKRIHSVASIQMGSASIHLFRWDIADQADTVTQLFLDKDGNELTVKTVEERILELVTRISDNPSVAASSNPYDYIKAKQDVYDELLSYGDAAVDCLVSYLWVADSDGLREYIMAAACAELTGIGKDKSIEPWMSASQWLNLYDGGSNILGTREDEIGGSIDVGSLLGINCVWIELVDTRLDPGTNRYLDTHRFYYMGNGKDYYTGTPKAETDLVTVKDCIHWKTGDFDYDETVELFVWVDDTMKPYRIYDLDGKRIVESGFDEVPDMVIDYEMLFTWDGLYLHEEKWAWLLKDPVTYIRELARRPEDRLYSGCPSGIIPEGTDTGVIQNTVAQIHGLLDDHTTELEKKIAFEILTEIEFSYTPELTPDSVNYPRLFEKWSHTNAGSSKELNCYNQMSALFDADPVAFIKGMAAADESALTKELKLAAVWLTNENFLYDAEAFDGTLDLLDRGAASNKERAMVSLFRTELEAIEKPSLEPGKLLSGEPKQLWDAFFYDPEQVLRGLGSCTEEQMKPLGQMLWGAFETGGDKLLDKGYAAVNRLLAENPTGTLKDVTYEFLLNLEWSGGYTDVYVPGQDFNYQRLFDKWTYSDGAMATSCNYQMFVVFEADPVGFLSALTQWDQTAPEGRYMEVIGRSFAYQFRGDNTYLQTLTNLLDNQAASKAAEVFLAESQKLTSE